MAKKSFLNSQDLEEASRILIPPVTPPDGQIFFDSHFNCQSFSQWLSLRLEARLRESKHWAKVGPIATGSWARSELCPKSDFDLIFSGSEDDVRALVEELHQMGLSMGYRVPEDPRDWTEGVESFDILALLRARPFTSEAASQLQWQQEKLKKQMPLLRKTILKAIIDERKLRAQRHDSMTSFLEPNLKYGPGGLRDIYQGNIVYELFSEKFSEEVGHALAVFKYYKAFFLTIRQKMHLDGYGEVLSANEQLELSRWFKYNSHKEFMRQVQRGLSRVSFYSDWILEQAQSSMAKIKKIESIEFQNISSPLVHLQREPGLLMQHKVRRNLHRLKQQVEPGELIGKLIMRAIHVSQKEKVTHAVFRSLLIHSWVPELNHLRGLVQHDQYHRFTADAHVFRAVREVQRVKAKPSQLGALKDIAQHLSPHDWKILSWTALYHDLGKGKEGRDHSEYGEELFEADAQRLKLSQRLTREVPWMVKNHLVLSHAAFRTDPHAPETWERLQQLGVVGKRLHRLAIFTAIDIVATNPDAWNSWKSRLLLEIVQAMEAPTTASYLRTREAIHRAGIDVREDFLRSLASSIYLALPTANLRRDLINLADKKDEDLDPIVVKDKNGLLWVRLHRRQDKLGLFEGFVGKLFSLGCKVRIAAIHTDHEYGAYDWFQVQTQRDADGLKKLLTKNSNSTRPIEKPEVWFQEIKLVSEIDGALVVSFKGPDQKGLLLAAASALRQMGAEVQWARVHTWGRQIDDVFGVEFEAGGTQLVEGLRKIVRLKEQT